MEKVDSNGSNDSFDADMAELNFIYSQVQQLESQENSELAGENLKKHLNVSPFEKASDLIAEKAKDAVKWLDKHTVSATTFTAALAAVAISMSPMGKTAIEKALGFASPADLSNELHRANTNESYGVNFTVNSELYGTYITAMKNGKHEIVLGVVDSIIAKAFEPTSFLTVSNELTSRFVAYHELAHGVLSKDIVEGGLFSNLKGDVEGIETLNLAINRVIAKNENMIGMYHEAFGDTLGAIAMIRNSNNTDSEIRDVVESRARQTHNQEHVANGVFGDLLHRTDLANEAVLRLDFDKVREMSTEQTIDLAKAISTELTMKKFSAYFNKIIDRTAELGKINPDQQEFLKNAANLDNKIMVKGVSTETGAKVSVTLSDSPDYCDELIQMKKISAAGLKPFESGLSGSEMHSSKQEIFERLMEKNAPKTSQDSTFSATMG